MIGNVFETFTGVVGELLVDAVEELAKEFGAEAIKWYCCPKEDSKKFENCQWYGTPGSCFDNHCPVNSHSVQLTDSPYGEGQDCYPRSDRARVFCCDPVGGASPFLPVSLEKLFPHPPEGDNVDTDHDLNVEDSGNPSDSAFSFVVMTSPDELQVSLDKRDGSHWELFNCSQTTSEAEQTIQMVCTDNSENSNCPKIGLGHGVPGTILQMPEGCGPGKYAVAKEMKMAKNQLLPRKFSGNLDHKSIVYDLTFDYDFRRVPRDLGDTQLRIDFSNEPGYWDQIVAASVNGKKRKSKRRLPDVGYSHKRWLEDEFRDDAHFGAVDRVEFHKRWFGETVLEWLGMMTKGEIKKTFKHQLDETYTAKIVEENWQCSGQDGHLLAQAQANIKVGTSFGFTLIAQTLFPLDLSKSYLSFSNNGEVSCVFTLDALVSFNYDSKNRNIGGPIPFPGATLQIPGIATIGPQLALRGRIEAGVTLSASLEAQVDVVSWEYDYRVPAEVEPQNPDPAEYGNTGNTNGLLAPTFYAGALAAGEVKAHLIAALEFGVTFEPTWQVDPLVASVAADSWMHINAALGASTAATCPFTWGMDAGVDLYAEAVGPGWKTDRYALPGSAKFTIFEGGQCPDLSQPSPQRRAVGEPELHHRPLSAREDHGAIRMEDSLRPAFAFADNTMALAERSLAKRAIGPFFSIPVEKLMCPNAASGPSSGKNCEDIRGWEDGDGDGDGDPTVQRRHETALSRNETSAKLGYLENRATDRTRVSHFCGDNEWPVPPYEQSPTLSTVSTPFQFLIVPERHSIIRQLLSR